LNSKRGRDEASNVSTKIELTKAADVLIKKIIEKPELEKKGIISFGITEDKSIEKTGILKDKSLDITPAMPTNYNNSQIYI